MAHNNYGFPIIQIADERYIDGHRLETVVDGLFKASDDAVKTILGGVLGKVRLSHPEDYPVTVGDDGKVNDPLQDARQAVARAEKWIADRRAKVGAGVVVAAAPDVVPDMGTLPNAPTSPAGPAAGALAAATAVEAPAELAPAGAPVSV